MPAQTIRFIRQFREVGIGDVAEVGGKNASLGEMLRELTGVGIRVPDGFATTAEAFRYFLARTGLDARIREILTGLDTQVVENLRSRGRRIREAILSTPLPDDLTSAVQSAYAKMCGASPEPIDVAVRTSATAEDLPEASFAGQHETFLNVRGTVAVVEAVRRSFASLFTDRAISYRADKGFDHLQVALSAGVQHMVRSDLGASGVMFSLDTETGFRDVVLINAAFGLGENIVQGTVNPDEFYVFKPTLHTGHRPIVRRRLGTKELKLVYDLGGSKAVKNVPVPADDRARFCISDDEVLTLARWACLVEDHYSRKHEAACPMDMEWAKDGVTGELYMLQARPETVHSRATGQVLETYHLKARGELLVSGPSVGEKIAAGPVRVIRDAHHLHEFRSGEVLVTDKTDPDWEPVMKKAAAIVTNRGGRTCHAAIVSRELGLPAVVGTEVATERLRNGQGVTVSCAEGEVGHVYQGLLDFTVERLDLATVGRAKTKVMMNVGNPEEAFALSFIPNDGVGLARMEFIISNSIRVHPNALLEFDRWRNLPVGAEIASATAGYADKAQFFVDRLAEGVGTIAAAFYPKDVIVRMSDFKTNEYANLIGGANYEPTEENPMIGFRGASRYYDPRYRDAFALECRAMSKVRDDFGLTNLKLMIPFCRTVAEGRRVQAEMAKHGLRRGERGLEIYVMCEIPSNVVCAAEFAEIFDGFSIGSNDLTQLMLGVDRDSQIIAHLFDERDLAVKRTISQAIRTVKQCGRKIGICGQAPSDYPEFAEFLVREGIDSMSLTPDVVLKTTARVVEVERNLAKG